MGVNEGKLKTLERLIELQIKEHTNIEGECKAHHGYHGGKSVETPLYGAVSTIAKSLKFKEYTLEVFLDIERARQTVLGVETLIINLVIRILENKRTRLQALRWAAPPPGREQLDER